MLLAGNVTAQDDGGDEGSPIVSDWSGLGYSLYSKGDKTFTITAGLLFPAAFIQKGGTALDNHVKVGGAGSLAYNYFLNPRVFIGGEVGGMFAATLGENYLYIISTGFRAGWQFTLGRFEFPVSLLIGGATQKYLDFDLYGFFMKPSAAVFFRLNTDWSFGLNAAWWWVPQKTSEPEKDTQGHFFEATLSAKYRF